MKYPLLTFGVLIAVSLSAAAQELTAEPFPRIWGAGIDLRYGDISAGSATSTALRGVFSAAYESNGYYRESDESLYSGDDESEPGYNTINGEWLIGIEQGLWRSSRWDRDFLTAFGYLRGRIDSNLVDDREEQLLYLSDLPDENGILQNSVVAGIYSDMVSERSPGRAKEGVYAELAGEWAPRAFLNDNIGRADFQRISARLNTFLPLFRLPERSIDLYLATRSIADIAFGDYLPMNAVQSFGGRDIEDGLGGTVRGLASGRYDASFKAAQNVELRLVLPPLWDGRILPGIVAYLDGGYYNDLASRSPVSGQNSGSSFSAGLGLSTQLFEAATLVFYSHYLLSGTRVNGSAWTPLGIGFGYHF